jgi:hypothetical protein
VFLLFRITDSAESRHVATRRSRSARLKFAYLVEWQQGKGNATVGNTSIRLCAEPLHTCGGEKYYVVHGNKVRSDFVTAVVICINVQDALDTRCSLNKPKAVHPKPPSRTHVLAVSVSSERNCLDYLTVNKDRTLLLLSLHGPEVDQSDQRQCQCQFPPRRGYPSWATFAILTRRTVWPVSFTWRRSMVREKCQ